MKSNIEIAENDFISYLKELKYCSIDRRKEIRHDAEVCACLMDYSSILCDFSKLHSLVTQVFVETNDD